MRCPDVELYYLNDRINLNTTQVNQVLKITQTKHAVVRYVTGSGPDSSTERLEIYFPSSSGYVEYLFVHTVSEPKNADIWRMAYAYEVDDSFGFKRALTTHGEWAMAVKLAGRPDFSGGEAHGDEVTKSCLFIVDGVQVALSDLTELTPFDTFDVIQVSAVYDPAVGSALSDAEATKTRIAMHNSLHRFTANQLILHQSVVWEISESLSSCYLAMHLPAKAVTSQAMLNNNYTPFTITQYGIFYESVTEALIYGDDVQTEFSIGKYPTGYTDSDKFLITDNNGGAYNKCYFVVATAGTVSAGDIWNAEVYYSFRC